MKALQIILNYFVLIVISAPFISNVLFKRQVVVYFGSWNPVLVFFKKKVQKNLFGVIRFWKRSEKCTNQLHFPGISVLPGAGYQNPVKTNGTPWAEHIP